MDKERIWENKQQSWSFVSVIWKRSKEEAGTLLLFPGARLQV